MPASQFDGRAQLARETLFGRLASKCPANILPSVSTLSVWNPYHFMETWDGSSNSAWQCLDPYEVEEW
jgi:hypothetical protein